MDSLKETDLNKSETSNEVKIAQTSNEVNIRVLTNMKKFVYGRDPAWVVAI